jgi:hypothetical protein
MIPPGALRLARSVTAAFAALFLIVGTVHGRRPYNPQGMTLGDIRTLISAEAAYQSSNGGYYDKPECLVRPWDCIPGYRRDAVSFLNEAFLRPSRHGFDFEFHPGLAAAGLSPSSVTGFAYVAIPNPTLTFRGFCGEDSGVICYTRGGSRPAVDRGHCVVAPGQASGIPDFLYRWLRREGDPDPCYMLR